MNKRKIKVVKEYKDIRLNRLVKVGETFEITKERLVEIQKVEKEKKIELVKVLDETDAEKNEKKTKKK